MAGCLPIAVSGWYLALWGVVGVVFVLSLLLVRSRWVRQRPLVRCVLMSLAAHAVLIGIAATIRFVSLPPGAGLDEPVRVTIVASAHLPSIKAPDTPAASQAEPVEQPLEQVSPEQTQPADPVEPQQEDPQPENPQPAEIADESPSAESSKPEPKLAAPDLMPEPQASKQPEPAAAAPPTPVKEAVRSEPVEASTKQPTDPMAQPSREPETVAATSDAESNVEVPPQERIFPQPVPHTSAPALPAPAVTPSSPAAPASLSDRVQPDRLQSVIEQGGSRDTEQAVGRALEWLAGAQSSDGRWDSDRWRAGREFVVLGHNRRGAGSQADTGITGLAVLTFLGAGHTHLDGPYKHEVAQGLVFLIRSQAADGCLSGEASFYARTYCHSMAAFALAEAYALSGDRRLEPSVRRAVDYLLECENRSFGGWRYKRGDQGDVSQLGWVIMALRSAELAGIDVPDDTWRRIENFLSRVRRGRSGGLAAYQARADWSHAMTAEAMYCRQVLGKPLVGAALGEALDALGSELPGEGLTNYYYWYYAALALHHAQHDGQGAQHTWNRWNERMKRELIAGQVTDGSNVGSWSPNTVWGGYGGRVYSTAMAAMCLEVYYRYGAASGEQSPWVASRPRGQSNRR